MSENNAVELDQAPIKRKNQFIEVMKRLSYNKGAIAGGIIIVLVIALAIIGPFLCPYNYAKIDVLNRLCSPCWEHPFGTDQLGRDILARILTGARYSLIVGIGSVIISSSLGIIVGCVAGFFGGKVDQTIMRLCDIVQAIPGMILNIAMSCLLGPGVINTTFALGISGISGTARLMRSSILNVRKMEYLDAAAVTNCGTVRTIVKHIFPNTFAPLLVQATMGVGGRIMAAAGMSYIGIGVRPPTPEWGAMLSESRNQFAGAPYLCLIPGICIMLVVLAMNLLGDGLRDACDPKLKK